MVVLVRQLEARHRLRGPAVRAVLQGRERPEQEEHPGQQNPLLPVLHLPVRTGVTPTHSSTPPSVPDVASPEFCFRLRPIDVEFMKALQDKANVVPVIAKADCLTPLEIKKFKERVRLRGRCLTPLPLKAGGHDLHLLHPPSDRSSR